MSAQELLAKYNRLSAYLDTPRTIGESEREYEQVEAASQEIETIDHELAVLGYTVVYNARTHAWELGK